MCMCNFVWDLSEYEVFVLNGNFELVATPESYIHFSPMVKSNSAPLHTAFRDKHGTYLKYDERKDVCQLFLKMLSLRILQIALTLMTIYLRYVSVITCIMPLNLLKCVI